MLTRTVYGRSPESKGACETCMTASGLRLVVLHTDRLLHADRDWRQPFEAVGGGAVDDAEKFFLQRLGNRSNVAFADGDLIHRTYRRDLCRRSGKEKLIGNVQHFARNHLLDNGNALVSGNAQDRIARDA